MGSLTPPPASGTIYLDANSVIYSVERVEPYRQRLVPYWDAANPDTLRIVTSKLTLLEVVVKPFKIGDAVLEQAFRTLLLGSSDVDLLAVSQDILVRAAQLRAVTTLRTPDAIHAATALEHGCNLFSTNDPAFRRVPALPVVVLSDALTP